MAEETLLQYKSEPSNMKLVFSEGHGGIEFQQLAREPRCVSIFREKHVNAPTENETTRNKCKALVYFSVFVLLLLLLLVCIYLFAGDIREVLACHDASEFGFNKAPCPLSL